MYADTKTGGLLGVIPLFLNLVMRLTETVDVKRGGCKHAVVILGGWDLHIDDMEALKCDSVAE